MKTVGVVGLGLLGRGIATCLLSHNFHVVGLDRDAAVANSAQQHIVNSLREMKTRGALSSEVHNSWPDRYLAATSIEQFQPCDFVIESVAEDMATKQRVFDQLEAVIGSTVPLGSNTSALPITQLQQGCRHPERLIGMHWAEPCHLTRFLEVIRGEQTNDVTAQAAMILGQMAGKEPSLVKRDVAGFIVNRLGYAMYREAFWLLEQGVADVETIDRSFSSALSVWANLMGPFRWMDLTGLAAYAAVMERLFPELSRATEVPETMRKLVESGARGIANGQGFYQYTADEAQQWEHRLTENVWRVNEMQRDLRE